MSCAASRAARRVSAATTASTSPTCRVVSPSATSWGQSRVIAPWVRSPGTSGAVTTATTRGSETALRTSIRSTQARGWSEERTAPCSMPGTIMSFTYGLSPSASSRPRSRAERVPTRPLVSMGGAARRGARRREVHGVDHLHVTRATAPSPASAWAISSRVGSALRRSRASAFMTIPGEQNPHCEAPDTTNASAQRSRSTAGSPS